MTDKQRQAIMMLLSAIVDSVKMAGDHGAPGGVLYAALMAHGITLDQFESLMSALVSAGKMTRKGHLYFSK